MSFDINNFINYLDQVKPKEMTHLFILYSCALVVCLFVLTMIKISGGMI